jgi:hypothetical protein
MRIYHHVEMEPYSGRIRDLNSSRNFDGGNSPDPSPPDVYWYQDPRHLWDNWRIIPTADMTPAQRINALARFVIVVSLILLLTGWGPWLLFLVVGLLLTYVLSKTQQRPPPEPPLVEYYQCPPRRRWGYCLHRS